MKNENPDKLLVQSYELVNAQFKLSSLALDIFYICAMQVSQYDTELKEYVISKKEVEALVNKEINFGDLKNAINSLSRSFINLAKRHTKEIYNVPIFYKISYNNSIIKAQIHPELEEHFLNLQRNFVSVDFVKYVSKLKSNYVKRIYIMLKQRAKLKSYRFSVEDLKTILGTPESFRYTDFKRRVLIKAVNEINLNTDILINFEEEKTGKSVSHITFTINYNSNFDKDMNEKEERKTIRKNKNTDTNKFRNKNVAGLEAWANGGAANEEPIEEATVVTGAQNMLGYKRKYVEMSEKEIEKQLEKILNMKDFEVKQVLFKNFIAGFNKEDIELIKKLKAKILRNKEKKRKEQEDLEKLQKNFNVA